MYSIGTPRGRFRNVVGVVRVRNALYINKKIYFLLIKIS